MYPVSADFKAAVIESHNAPIRAAAYLGDTEVYEFDVISGSVTADIRRAGPLRSLSLAVAPSDQLWTLLTTYGVEIKVWRGVRIDGEDEMVPLGVFVVDSDITQTNDDSVTIGGADRSTRISRNRWVDPYAIASGTDLGTALGALLRDRWGACPIGFTTMGVTIPGVVLQSGAETDPWKDAKSIAEARGFDLYFDGAGVAQLRTVPDPMTATSVATYEYGDIVISQTRKAVLSRTYNGAIATGQGTEVTAPVRGESWDDEPTSPTYRYGPMGMVPYFLSSSLLTTQAQVDLAAQTLLAKIRGRTEGMEWDLLPNPAHEPGDLITLDGTDYMIDALTIPLDVRQSMKADARETRTT